MKFPQHPAIEPSAAARICVLIPSAVGAQAIDASWRDESAAASGIIDRMAPALSGLLNAAGELASDWQARPEGVAALDQVAGFIARGMAPSALSVLCDPRLAWLAPVWTAALETAGIQVFLVAAPGADGGDASGDIAFRDRLLSERDVEIAALRNTVAVQGSKLHRIFASRSWTLTRPLRTLGALVRGERAIDLCVDDDFDAAWYLAQYPDVAASGIDPHQHYLSNGKQEGRLPMAPWVVAPQPVRPLASPWWHGLVRRIGAGRRALQRGSVSVGPSTPSASGEEFDAEFYLLQYPDIAAAGLDAYEHYVSYGKAEGRQGVRPRLVIEAGGIGFDASRGTILVVSHEASRTGAPVLSLNLVQQLQERYNVIALLIGGGPLSDEFRRSCAWLAGPMELRGSPARAAVIIDQLVDLHPLKFAIVNSIESRAVLEPLARRRVATVSLVHEFAAYTRPKQSFRDALHWADKTVFSTPLTLESACLEFPDLVETDFVVLPQGRCKLPLDVRDEAVHRLEESRLLAALRPRGKSDDAFVVLGAGFVQQRKGVDLFIKCASHVLASDRGKHCRFVWIGSGYDPERDMAYSVYLADQLRRAGLENRVRIIDETSSIETAYQAADLLLLSSRLDPLPNVAIDAMAHGLPVVCFDKTTGIANVLIEEGLSDQLVARYLDTHDMASKVLELASSPSLRESVTGRVREVVRSRFNMQAYVAALEALALAADRTLLQRKDDVQEIVGSGLFRPDFHGARFAPDARPESVIEFEYLRSWSSGIGCRKPFPGFHPGVYRQARGLAPSLDPLAEFVRTQRPDGDWCREVIVPNANALVAPPEGRIALHVHAYYPDMLADILARLAGNSVRPDLFISVPSNAVMALVEPTLASYGGVVAQVRVVPNRGRDIGPFLTAFGPALLAYDVIGHLHTKKSLDLNDAAFAMRWNTFLLDNLLGRTNAMADAIVGRLLTDSRLGLVFPDDPHVVGWSGNLAHAESLAARMYLGNLPKEFTFPVGTMFWAKPAALAPLIGLGLQWDDYPIEPLGYDGTVLHAIERLLPIVVESCGYRCAVTNVPGVTR